MPLPPVTRLSGPRQWRLIALIAGAIVAIALLIGAVRALTTPKPPEEKPLPPGTVRLDPSEVARAGIMRVGVGNPGESIQAVGVISVDQNHTTPVLLNYSGQVAQVYVEAGDRVGAGQPLLRIASPDLVDAVNASLTARANQATAAAQLATASLTAERQKQLFETAGGAEKDYRQAQTDLIAAQSAKRASDAAVLAAQNKLALYGRSGGGGSISQVIYRAPVAGTIATRDVAIGQFVGAGGDKPLLTISDLSRVWLVAQLSEQYAARIRKGDVVRVTTPAYPGRTFEAVIDNVAASLDPATRKLAVRASVNNPDSALKPQMSARFAIAPAQSPGDSIIVPAAAIIYEGDTARVWVLGDNGLARARTVQVGETNGATTRIAAGLKPGERIVTSGALFVNEAGLGE
ncbi:MAG: efflux RND transporter periplasmic adaptor subunit [Sphingomonas sp.]|nr:efflux RND transporter periplasmic adaptor subunit [Sphingomonas sp.]